jgi:Gnt-I system high-affinity gluconate transporter
MKEVMKIYEIGLKEITTIILVIGASGGLKQIMLDAHIGNVLASMMTHIVMHPLLLGWFIAAVIRILLGSATVAGLTATGIIVPLMPHLHADVHLMILAIGSGSIFCSHVNDTGFWMFKEYFNLSVKETFLSWSIMESIASVVSLFFIIAIDFFL